MTTGMPKNILRIEDLTFILSDNFQGDFVDALEEMTGYMRKFRDHKKDINDENSTIQTLLSSNDEKSRVCMRYGIFEQVDEKNYKPHNGVRLKDNQGI